MPVTIDRRPRRFLPLLLAVTAIAGLSGQSAGDSAPHPGAPTGRAVVPSTAPALRIAMVPSAVPAAGLHPLPFPARRPAHAPAVDLPRHGVPIVYYHRVESIPPGFRSWSRHRKRTFLAYDSLPAAFEAQLDWLQANGYTTILPRDLAAHWDAGEPLPRRPVILAFDDGSPTWMHKVLPALKARGMVAEFYLTLDAIKHGNLTWAQVRRLARAGNGIGAHDVHHVQLAGVPHRKPASRKRMFHEVNGARRAIAAHVGVAPDSMAYVGGGFDARLIRQVRRRRLHDGQIGPARHPPARGPSLRVAGRAGGRARRRAAGRRRGGRSAGAGVRRQDGGRRAQAPSAGRRGCVREPATGR